MRNSRAKRGQGGDAGGAGESLEGQATSAESIGSGDAVAVAEGEGAERADGASVRDAVEESSASTEPASSVASVDETQPNAELPPAPELEPAEAPGQGDLLTDDELLQSVSALVFASPEPLSEKRLVALLDSPRAERVRAAIVVVKERLAESGLPLEMRLLAGGWQILTAPAVGEVVQRLFKARKAERVSAAALETLAVIAYRQPVSKAEIEAIRGVQAAPILRTLIDRGLVRVTGRADVPGHPLQYGTTKNFLDRFGLGALDELPRDTELAKD